MDYALEPTDHRIIVRIVAKRLTNSHQNLRIGTAVVTLHEELIRSGGAVGHCSQSTYRFGINPRMLLAADNVEECQLQIGIVAELPELSGCILSPQRIRSEERRVGSGCRAGR